jgi:hypothetical protein
MKRLSIFVLVIAALVGCNNSDPEAVKPAAPLNPSGKPRNAAEQELADEHAKAGMGINAQRAAAAKARSDAMAKAGAH